MRRRRNRDVAWLVGAAAVAAVAAGLIVGQRPFGASEAPAPVRATAPSAPSEPAAPVRTSAIPAQPATAELRLVPPYEVADGLTILTETRRIRLSGLDGPAAEAVCFDPTGQLWACGLQARAALRSLIRGQPVTCRTTGARQAEAVMADCRIGESRLARALVEQGFARPAANTGGLDAELETARSERRGMWKGGWRIRN